MPTTILDGESYEQALHRRYAEESALDARLSDLAEQVECSTITRDNMEGRLNGWLVKYAAMKEQRDDLLAALEQFLDPEGNPPEDTGEWREVLRVIASVKGGA